MILLVDPQQDELLDVNPKACWAFGYSREELLSMPLSAIYLDDLEKLQEFARVVFKAGQGWSSELTCVTRSGELLSTETSGFVLVVEGRSCLAAMVRDVTGVKRGERDLQESNLRLAQRINQLNKLNAVYRENLRAHDEGGQKLPEDQ